jgi:hypothetical protein
MEPITLKSNPDLPDPLTMLSGEPVRAPQDWFDRRRPELRELFQHYMYGQAPPAPEKVESAELFVEPEHFGGKATLKEVSLRFGPPTTPAIRLLVAIPNRRSRPAPAFVGPNFCGNHTAAAHAKIAVPQGYVPDWCPASPGSRASEAGRGAQAGIWDMEHVIDRGYAVATFYHGDVDPDRNDFTDGVHPHYYRAGQLSPGPHDWGTIAAWAWGISRAVDYLAACGEIDPRRIAAVGHSRNGKAAFLAGALDERIALTASHQAGCGGSAPSRGTVGESVKEINDSFPHWFCDEFKRFNGRPDLLPFDQHCLAAMVAPRALLFTNGVQDTWANPEGQFHVLQAADKVYRLLGAGGLDAEAMPPLGKLIDSKLGYFIREGGHSMGRQDWDVFLAFADKWMK